MSCEHADPDAKAAEDRMPVDQWLAIRKEAASKIDPKTAKVTFSWGTSRTDTA
jgi:hypothetical protein